MTLIKITGENFDEEVLQSELPVLADLWAPWCAPCKMLEPTINKIANEYSGRIKVVKINIDENPMIAMKYQIMSIPTTLLFDKGNIVEQIVGLVPKSAVLKRIQSYI